jgi:hypothetical protein
LIEGILSKDVDTWWPYVTRYLEDALEHGLGEYNIDDIRNACKEKNMQLWAVLSNKVEGAFITKVAQFPQKNILVVLLLGGDNFKDWKHEADSLLLAFGKENKCEYVELFGRKGWARELKDINYKEQTRIIAKEII